MKINTQHINVYTESNPNPNALKFVTNIMLIPEGINRDYPAIENTIDAPLAQALFEQFDFIKGVFYMSNFVTVTKEESTDWMEVKADVQLFIKEWLQEKKSVLTENLDTPSPVSTEDNDMVSKINQILEEYIKPAVESDGGAIKLSSYEDGIVKVILQGACSGCPSSTITLKNGIENLLKQMIPEVKEVVAQEG